MSPVLKLLIIYNPGISSVLRSFMRSRKYREIFCQTNNCKLIWSGLLLFTKTSFGSDIAKLLLAGSNAFNPSSAAAYVFSNPASPRGAQPIGSVVAARIEAAKQAAASVADQEEGLVEIGLSAKLKRLGRVSPGARTYNRYKLSLNCIAQENELDLK